MTRVSIEIEDIGDRKACVLALRKLFTALEDYYGGKEADNIWRYNNYDPRAPYWLARFKLNKALSLTEPDDQRLIFEYYAMAKPSKEGLAKELARRNGPLHDEWREWLSLEDEWLAQRRAPRPPPRPPAPYGPRGTTDWRTMLQHIKRVFRKHRDACIAVEGAPHDLREEELQEIEDSCRVSARLRAAGIKPHTLRSIRARSIRALGRRGTKSREKCPGTFFDLFVRLFD
jgi:hypothetical protein